jgi:hypothetical protein
MGLTSSSLTLRAPRSMKRKPRRAVGHLSAVVKEVKSALKSGTGVYLRSRSASYAQRIRKIRVASFGDFLRVKTIYGWSTVWYSEYLVDEFGAVLFSMVHCDDWDWIVSLIEDLGVLPLSCIK